MSFTHPEGSRGGKQPAGVVMRWMNKIALAVSRRRGGTFGGMNVLKLTTIGRKSGQPRSTPVAWFPGPDDSWIVVASANGARYNPAWYSNLAAHPDEVTIEVAGTTVPVSARELHDTERDEAWARITTASPRFAQYEQKTDRTLPVVQLTRRS